MEGLFCNNCINVRQYFNHALYLLSQEKSQKFQIFLLKILIKNIPDSSDESKKECMQFNGLLSKLLEETNSEVAEKSGIDFAELMNRLI